MIVFATFGHGMSGLIKQFNIQCIRLLGGISDEGTHQNEKIKHFKKKKSDFW